MSKSRKDPANGCTEPSRPQTECHLLERRETGPHALTCLPWHHTHLPKPLSKDARKTLAQKQPHEEAAWDELGPVPPHHEDDGDSTMSLRGGVVLSCLGPFHTSQARRHSAVWHRPTENKVQHPQPERAHQTTYRSATEPPSPPARE